ncbi:MAG: hypothetical protein II211_06435 [Peptococcaceae bacterium]|nr:hypothetical protein [Peptococcaceae bacterium]
MGLFGKENKLSVPAAMISAVGIAGTVLWQKKDWIKCVAELRKNPAGYVVMSHEPEVYITKATEEGKEGLFAYLATSQWHLADQIADGFFWINEHEEILLLSQKKVMKDYWQWTASRPFFAEENE